MPNPEIEEFAQTFVQHVRDAVIQNCDGRLRPDARDAVAKRWKEAMHEGNVDSVVRLVIPDIVDSALAHLCRAIDQGLLQLSFTARNGKSVSLPIDGRGELTGWYMGSDGWRAMYAKERFVDDFSDLRATPS